MSFQGKSQSLLGVHHFIGFGGMFYECRHMIPFKDVFPGDKDIFTAVLDKRRYGYFQKLGKFQKVVYIRDSLFIFPKRYCLVGNIQFIGYLSLRESGILPRPDDP